MLLDSTNGSLVDTRFTVPTGSIAINGDDGDDTITFQAMPAAFPGLTIAGQGDNDTVNFNGDITLAANNNLTVAAVDVINVLADLVLSGTGKVDHDGRSDH